MFSDCCSPEDLRREAARQRGLAGFLKDKDRVVAANLRASAEELERQAQLIEGKSPAGPQQSAA